MYDDEVADAALVVELDRLAVGPLVGELDAQALREERGLAQPLRHGAGVDVDLLEDLRVRHERDGRAGVVGSRVADDLHVALRDAARELLAVGLAVTAHLGDEPLGQRVHDGDADAVQAAGNLVAVAAELAAGVELRQDDRQRGQILLRHEVDRDAVAPVADGHRVVGMEVHLDAVVAACEGLVDRVVDHLVDEMMEASLARRADVHARTEPDRLEAFEHGNVLCGIDVFSHEKSPANPTFAGTPKCIRTSGRSERLRVMLRQLSQRVCGGLRRRSPTPISPPIPTAPESVPEVTPEGSPVGLQPLPRGVARGRTSLLSHLPGALEFRLHAASIRTPTRSRACERSACRRA